MNFIANLVSLCSMPACNVTACFKEVKNARKTHPCSENEGQKFLQGHEISESLALTEMH